MIKGNKRLRRGQRFCAYGPRWMVKYGLPDYIKTMHEAAKSLYYQTTEAAIIGG